MVDNPLSDYFKKTGEGSVVDWWDPETSGRLHLYDHEVRLLATRLKSGVGNDLDKVEFLELGSGNGRVRCQLGELDVMPDDADYTCLDINSKMNERAQKRFARNDISVKLIRGDATQLPFKDNSFDVVICMNTMVHFNNPNKVISEVSRVLRPGGLFISNIDNKFSLRRLLRGMINKVKFLFDSSFSPRGQGVFYPFLVSEYKNLLKDGGFEINYVDYYGIFAPVDLEWNSKKIYLIHPTVSRLLFPLGKLMSKVWGVRTLSNYCLFVANNK